MEISIGAAQWIGERERQEDSLSYGLSQDGRYLLVLADGMGGHSGGEIASSLASSAALESLLKSTASPPEALQNALDSANLAISKYVETTPAHTGMGTTLICVVVENGKLWWSSVGDSHLYLFRRGDIKKLNADHSMSPVLRKMVIDDEITAEQAASDPKRNALRSALMGEEIALVDLSKRPIDLLKGDAFVLCTDGVDSIQDITTLSAIIGMQNTAQNTATELLNAVKVVEKPKQDNTSLIVAQVDWRKTTNLIEETIIDHKDHTNSIRQFILPSITIVLVLCTLWYSISKWRIDSKLEYTKVQLNEITAKNAELEEKLEIKNQEGEEVSDAQMALDSMAIAVLDHNNVSENLAQLSQTDLMDQTRVIVLHMINLIAKNQTLSAQQLILEKRNQALKNLLKSLDSDDVLASMGVLINNINDDQVLSLTKVILDQLQIAKEQATNELIAREAAEQKLMANKNRLLALKEALSTDTLDKFIEQFSGTIEAKIAMIINELFAARKINTDLNTNGQVKN